MDRTLRMLALPLFAALALGCDSSSSRRESGAFPFTLTGAASDVSACGPFGLANGEIVTLGLFGTSLKATIEPFRNDCEAEFSGAATLILDPGAAGIPGGFILEIDESCDDIADIDLNSANDFTLSTGGFGHVLSCITTTEGGLGVLRCTVDACSFAVANPAVGVLFDYEDAILDAF